MYLYYWIPSIWNVLPIINYDLNQVQASFGNTLKLVLIQITHVRTHFYAPVAIVKSPSSHQILKYSTNIDFIIT